MNGKENDEGNGEGKGEEEPWFLIERGKRRARSNRQDEEERGADQKKWNVFRLTSPKPTDDQNRLGLFEDGFLRLLSTCFVSVSRKL